MHRRLRWVAVAVVVLMAASLLAACGKNKKEEAGPAPTDTPTLEPSPVGGSLAGGTPFPPTWTPAQPPTSTPQVASGSPFPTLPPAPTWTALPEYCYELTVIGGDTEMRVNTRITLRWTPISGFSDYLVLVYYPGGVLAHQQLVKGTEYTVPGEIFGSAGVYGWEIWPINEQGERVCFPAGGEIVVSF